MRADEMPIRHMASKLLDLEPATGPGAKPDVYHGLACLALVALAACSALVCVARRPQCPVCPMRPICRAYPFEQKLEEKSS